MAFSTNLSYTALRQSIPVAFPPHYTYLKKVAINRDRKIYCVGGSMDRHGFLQVVGCGGAGGGVLVGMGHGGCSGWMNRLATFVRRGERAGESEGADE